MYTLIQKIDDYYLLSSVQKHITNYNEQHSVKYSKRYQDIFDRGCMYKDETMSQPVVTPFNEVLKMKATTNIKDIVNLFFTQKEIRKRSKLRYPKLLKNFKSYVGHRGGNNGSVRYLSSDERRNVLTYEYNEIGKTEQPSYVIKIAKNDHYSCAYKDESRIYENLCNWDTDLCHVSDDDVITYYGSGEVEKDLDGAIFINIQKNKIILNNVRDELIGKHYLVLENTNKQDFMDFSEYIKNNNNINCIIVFDKIIQTIKQKKKQYGFFHGDLHADNVKVDNKKNIKLFDFDFSGIINPEKSKSIISRNILIYNLKKQENKLFLDSSSANVNNSSSANVNRCNNNVIINEPLEINDFMFAFDYFRLLFSLILEFENKIEIFDLEKYKQYIHADDLQIYTTIIDWHKIQVTRPEWRLCFKDNYFFESIFKYTSFTEKTPQVCSTQNISQNISQEQPKPISHVLATLQKTTSNASSSFSSDMSSGGRKKMIMRKQRKQKSPKLKVSPPIKKKKNRYLINH
jgi:hypothetical protein